ncbi:MULTISPECIES: prepilin-type N-terminal cleavage/methylation domain-containing protein [Pseudomonas]|uniref:prepilin-type N-terminal cleavage/methylation domain-containing protein n=1 Tax=Pseudomonas TaxID=286 RepID=UPI0009309D4D|nr:MULTISPECIES: prepilin-type N-terminal cleavage/methylation domain-containing protein [Pseudomonas]NHN68212.1 prepilin-type N-terminal cleavage/methylation domain-containing protein [Pseudomonas fluorescens]
MRRAYNAQSGFTLIEILAATALLAVALGIFMGSMGQSMQAYKKDELKTRMGLLARSLIVARTPGRLEPGVATGQQNGIDWRLECTVAEAQSDIQLFQLKLILRYSDVIENFSTLRVQSTNQGR